jgi:hypothetical protein
MTQVDFRVDFDADKAVAPVYGQQMVFHCHHYNTFLQQTIEDPEYIDGPGILTEAAREVAAEQLQQYLQEHAGVATPAERLAVAAEFFRLCGFGTLDFSRYLAGEKTVVAPHSHYAEGWLVKMGQRDKPCCFFAAGFVAGALDVAHDRPAGHHRVSETACKAVAGDHCAFAIEG